MFTVSWKRQILIKWLHTKKTIKPQITSRNKKETGKVMSLSLSLCHLPQQFTLLILSKTAYQELIPFHLPPFYIYEICQTPVLHCSLTFLFVCLFAFLLSLLHKLSIWKTLPFFLDQLPSYVIFLCWIQSKPRRTPPTWKDFLRIGLSQVINNCKPSKGELSRRARNSWMWAGLQGYVSQFTGEEPEPTYPSSKTQTKYHLFQEALALFPPGELLLLSRVLC